MPNSTDSSTTSAGADNRADDFVPLPDFAGAEIQSVDDLEAAEEAADPKRRGRKKKKLKVVDEDPVSGEEPLMSSPEWHDFVMGHFAENEVDSDGKPFVHGLRRVARLLLGPILYSGPAPGLPFQAPAYSGDGKLNPAVVGYKVKILMCRTESDTLPAYEAEFADVADCYDGNTDPPFSRFPSPIASTRAEARCFRKALQIRGIAAEEGASMPALELEGKIRPETVNAIDKLCARNDVDAMAFVNSGEKKYKSVRDVDAARAARMMEHLSKCENEMSFPAHLMGYKPGWSKK